MEHETLSEKLKACGLVDLRQEVEDCEMSKFCKKKNRLVEFYSPQDPNYHSKAFLPKDFFGEPWPSTHMPHFLTVCVYGGMDGGIYVFVCLAL